jgi:hypothetical protein
MSFKETKRKGFNFFRSYYDVYNELESDKDKLAFINALLDRQFLGEKPEGLKGMAKFAWISQVNSIDSQVKGYEDKTGVKLTPLARVEINPTPQVEEKGKEKGKEKEKDIYPFDLFWSKYPKKVAKDKCKTSFNRLSLTEKKAIFDTLDNFLKFKPFKDYTHPNPSTYLNQKRWEDEVEEVKPMKIEHNGVMRDVAFYKEDGTPVFKGTTAPTLQQIQEASS